MKSPIVIWSYPYLVHESHLELIWSSLLWTSPKSSECFAQHRRPGEELSSVQYSRSVMSDSLRPMDCSMTDFHVHHQLPEFTQTHVHWVGNTIQLSHPLSSPSPPSSNHSQHQGLFQWVSSLHQMAKVLEFQLQHQSFQWIFRTDFL